MVAIVARFMSSFLRGRAVKKSRCLPAPRYRKRSPPSRSGCSGPRVRSFPRAVPSQLGKAARKELVGQSMLAQETAHYFHEQAFPRRQCIQNFVDAQRLNRVRAQAGLASANLVARPRKVRAHLARGGEDYQLTVCRGQSALGTKVGLDGGDALREPRHVNQRPKRPARTAATHNAVPDGLIFGRKLVAAYGG